MQNVKIAENGLETGKILICSDWYEIKSQI